MYSFKSIIYFLIIGFAAIVGLIQYKKLDKASKIIVWYLLATFTLEGIATIAAIIYRNNLPIYHVYSPLQFVILSIYFNISLKHKKIYPAGYIIATTGIVLSILNSIYLQHPMKQLNTNFIVLESFLIIGMSLFAFYKMLVSDFTYIHLSPRFWFSSIFLVFWSFTFFYWLVGVIIYKSMPDKAIWLNLMIWFINIVAYSGIAAVFLFYKKMKPV